MKTLAVFGSTGSIGTSTLDIVSKAPNDFSVTVLTAHSNWRLLVQQALNFKPQCVVISDAEYLGVLKEALEGTGIEILCGEEGLAKAASCAVDLHIAAIVGIAGLKPVFSAIQAGIDIALANKEALVCAGMLLMEEACQYNVKILPLDSEHNAMFQVLEDQNRDTLSKIILTASGGPFLNKKRKELQGISVEQALAHPNWSMGRKISIDSATMANKSLEMLEAVYLFDLLPDQLEVVIHPQSIVHSMVEYQDGSILAQMGAHDMRIPIGYTLYWPERKAVDTGRLDFQKALGLSFEPLDIKRFPLVGVMKDIIAKDRQKAIVFNAANEIAVSAFLEEKIDFLDIENIITMCVDESESINIKNIEDVFAFDEKTRRMASAIIKTKN